MYIMEYKLHGKKKYIIANEEKKLEKQKKVLWNTYCGWGNYEFTEIRPLELDETGLLFLGAKD